MKHQLTLIFLLCMLFAGAQKKQEIFDHRFEPTKQGGYYYVVTEKTDPLWKRQAFYLSHKTLYMEGSYKDEACKVKHGVFTWYHANGYVSSTGRFVNGLREGVFLGYDDGGVLNDSVHYSNGRKIGIGLGFYKNGYLSDSTYFDGNGNGIEVRWYDDGSLASAGYWTQDTLKKGRWKYYHRNGTVKATEDYDDKGQLTQCNCYEVSGAPLDTAQCREKEAFVNKVAWKRFLENSLQKLVDEKAKEGLSGSFTVIVRFVVENDGRVNEVRAMTNYGYGIEEEVVNCFKKAPKWEPGRMHGRLVRSYHTQPVTFTIQ